MRLNRRIEFKRIK